MNAPRPKTDSSTATFHRAGEAELRWMGETSTYFLAGERETNGAFSLVEEHARGGATVPLHRHAGDVESFYVLDGEIAFFVDGQPEFRARPGAFVHVPPGVVHGFRIVSDDARYLIFTTSRHGEFYRAITVPSGEGKARPLESLPDDAIGRACVAFGVDYVGPLPDVRATV